VRNVRIMKERKRVVCAVQETHLHAGRRGEREREKSIE